MRSLVCLLIGLWSISAHLRSHHSHHKRKRKLFFGSNDCGTRDGSLGDSRAQSTALITYRRNQLISGKQGNSPKVIPVCFNVVVDKKGNNDVSLERAQAQLDALNVAFSNRSCCNDDFVWCNSRCSIDTGFQFAFAMVGSDNGVTKGATVPFANSTGACVIRTVKSLYAKSIFNLGVIFMQRKLHRGDKAVLNVYFPELAPGLNGQSSLPWGFGTAIWNDGAVISSLALIGSGNSDLEQGDTMAHEVGHWLGLQHPWRNACKSEGIADTPRVKQRFSGCSNSTDIFSEGVCREEPSEMNNANNFMDGGNDDCSFLFTAGQVESMHAAYEYYRGNGPGGAISLIRGVPSTPVTIAQNAQSVYRLDTIQDSAVTCSYTSVGETKLKMGLKWNRPPKYSIFSDDCLKSGEGASCTVRAKKSSTSLYVGVTAAEQKSVLDVVVQCSAV